MQAFTEIKFELQSILYLSSSVQALDIEEALGHVPKLNLNFKGVQMA